MVVMNVLSDKQLNTSGKSDMDEDETNIDLPQDEKDSSDGSAKDEKTLGNVAHNWADFKIRYSEVNYHASGCHKSVQAVVLAAGTGSRMTTLVTHMHKCLLPIASIPMLYFPIHMLQSSGFTECLVVVSSGCEKAVAAMARDYNLSIELDIHTVDPSQDPGTLDSLRHIASAIKTETQDVLLISSDIISDLNVGEMIRIHRHKRVALTMLTTTQTVISRGATPGHTHKTTIGPDLLFESISEMRLSKSVSGGDYEETVTIPYSQLVGGTINVTKGSVDAHLYIISNKLLKQYVLSNTSPCADMTSLKAEVVPHLVAQQYKKSPNADYEAATQTMVGPFDALMRKFRSGPVRGRRTQSSRSCVTYHYDSGLCVRANTIPNYWYLNSKVPAFLSILCPGCPVLVGSYSTSQLQPKAVVQGNTLLGAGCQLHDRTTVSNSSLGHNCVVSAGCRVTDSVLMDNVTLEPGCVLDNCIVCCTIDKEKCTLKSSIVASSRTLESNKTVVKETLEETQFFSA